MFSDDTLFTQLALKGGNALNLVHQLGSRSSLDVDLSLETDFDDIDDSRERIFRTLKARFAEASITVFDEKFGSRPPHNSAGDKTWGGYQVEFKLMETAKYETMKDEEGFR